MHISITAEVAPSSSPRFSIFRRAEIIASGFLVSSTAPASARNSRERESAKRTTSDRNQARKIAATATRIARMAPPPPFLSPSDDEEDDDEERPLPKLQFELELKNKRKKISAAKPTTPAMMTAITISCTSPLRMWVSSCPSTASSSSSLRPFSNPLVTVTEYWRWLRPLANAFSASVSMIFSFGIGMPREMQRFSSRL